MPVILTVTRIIFFKLERRKLKPPPQKNTIHQGCKLESWRGGIVGTLAISPSNCPRFPVALGSGFCSFWSLSLILKNTEEYSIFILDILITCQKLFANYRDWRLSYLLKICFFLFSELAIFLVVFVVSYISVCI